jgi:hypothetical protein
MLAGHAIFWQGESVTLLQTADISGREVILLIIETPKPDKHSGALLEPSHDHEGMRLSLCARDDFDDAVVGEALFRKQIGWDVTATISGADSHLPRVVALHRRFCNPISEMWRRRPCLAFVDTLTRRDQGRIQRA